MNELLFTFTLQKEFFDAVEEGRKSVEGRLFRPKYFDLKCGDTVIFKHSDEPQHYIEAALLYLNRYPSFELMLQTEGIEKCLPGIDSIAEGVRIYHSFPQYKELEEECGVLAIGFRMIKVVKLNKENSNETSSGRDKEIVE